MLFDSDPSQILRVSANNGLVFYKKTKEKAETKIPIRFVFCVSQTAINLSQRTSFEIPNSLWWKIKTVVFCVLRLKRTIAQGIIFCRADMSLNRFQWALYCGYGPCILLRRKVCGSFQKLNCKNILNWLFNVLWILSSKIYI